MFPICVIKNTSGGAYALRNQNFAADLDTYQIPDQLRLAWANDELVIQAISDGDIQVGDGVSFLSDISQQVDRLKAFIPNPLSAEVTSTVSATLSQDAKIESSYTKVDLPSSSSSYLDIYTYSGSADLFSFTLKFNSDRVLARLEIDGEEIFAEDCDVLESLVTGDDDEGGSAGGPLCWLAWDKAKNVLRFCPPLPYKVSTSLKIQAKANSSSSARDCEKHWVTICK